MLCSISSRTSHLTKFFQNADSRILSSFLNHAFTAHPSLAHVNFIILTLLQISEDAQFTWEQFRCFLASSYEYLQEWKKTESSAKIYQKVISEMHPIVDQAYKKKGSTIIQDPIVSILMTEANNYVLSPEELFDSVLHRVNFELKKIEKRADSLHYHYLNEFLILLNNIQQRSLILASLQRSRFDKKEFNLFLSHSIIMGADNGIYVLLNTFSQHEQNLLSTHSQINPEMINLIMDDRGKTVIGEGSFGKIRMAMAIVPNSKNETSLIPGSIICVKKAGSKRTARDKLEIWDSTWNDYCSIDFLDDAPEIFDMKITDDCNKMLQGYCFQRLLMLPNGIIFKKNKTYQKWIHVKHYFIGIFKLMIKLHERDICMTDLKPANTLYDKQSLTTKLVDLAGAVRNVDLHSCKVRHVTETTPMYTAPELKNSNDPNTIVDLVQCISWSIGHMMEEICKPIKEFIEPVSDSKIQRVKDEINILIKDLKVKRISLEEGLKRLMEIPELEEAVVKNFEGYMDLLKTRLHSEDPDIRDILNLKNDIYTLCKCFNDKLKISNRNSDLNVYDPLTDDSINDLLPCMRKLLQIDEQSNLKKEVLILFGSAGSGKSTVLQKLFIEAVDSWTIGDSIPIFMNLSILYDLKDYWKNLKDSLGLEHLNFEDLIKQPLRLFLDSLDESGMDLRVITNILNSFSSYANVNSVKIIVTCRTGYLEEENEQNRLKENIKCSRRYIIPLNHFFFKDKSNLEELIALYLHQSEKKEGNELTDLLSAYILKINEFHLKEIMKTTHMIFIILAVIPTLMKIDPSIPRQEIDFLTVYQLYLEKNLENEISKSTDEAIRKKSVCWFMQVGVSLAEAMMLTKKATNQLRKKDALNFLSHPILAEIGETYNQRHPLTEHISIYNILRTLNINIHFLQKPPYEKITLSFPHDTIKNYFLTRGMIGKLPHDGDEFPEWVSQRLVTGDRNLVRFMVEAMKKSSKLTAASERAILSTKQSDDPKLITRAANLITFLVASNYSFFGKDLSYIKIRGANISDGIFNGCNFDYADLSNVVLNHIKIDNASFLKTNLKDVVLNVYPYFRGHTGYVNSVAFSSDGKKVASASDDKTIRIWDCESGKEIRKFEGHRSLVTFVAFSSDGKKLVSGSNDLTARIWNADNGKELKRFESHFSIVTSAAFSYDGNKVVSGCNDKIVRIWNARSGKLIKKYENHQHPVSSVAFSLDGKKVVSGSNDAVRVWYLQSEKEMKTLKNRFNYNVNPVAFSSDGRKVISGNGRFIILWDLESGKELKKYQGNSGYPFSSVAFSPDGKKLVSGSHDQTVIIWDVENEKELKKFDDHIDRVNSVAFSSNGKKVVSGSADKTIRIYDVEDVTELKKYEGHSNWVFSVSFSADGKRVVSGSVDKTVRIWDAETGKELKKFEGHTETVISVSYSFDGKKVVSGSNDGTIRIWDVDNEKELKKFSGPASSVSFSFDGNKVISCDTMYDKTFQIWEVETGKQLKKYEGHSDYITSVDFSPDGKKGVSGSNDKTVRIWDIESGKEFLKCEGHTLGVTAVAFSYEGTKIVSGSFDKTVRIWDAENGKELKKNEGHVNRVLSVAFSTDGKKVISGSADKTIRIWDVESGREIKKYEIPKYIIDSVAFSSDGTKIVCANANMIRFYRPLDENKNTSLIISSSATPLSCLNCINYKNAINCSNRLLALFNQNNGEESIKNN